MLHRAEFWISLVEKNFSFFLPPISLNPLGATCPGPNFGSTPFSFLADWLNSNEKVWLSFLITDFNLLEYHKFLLFKILSSFASVGVRKQKITSSCHPHQTHCFDRKAVQEIPSSLVPCSPSVHPDYLCCLCAPLALWYFISKIIPINISLWAFSSVIKPIHLHSSPALHTQTIFFTSFTILLIMISNKKKVTDFFFFGWIELSQTREKVKKC